MSVEFQGVVGRLWISYRDATIPREAGTTQLTESRRAFFAGAAALYFSIMNILDPGVEVTDKDLAVMTEIRAELERFNAAVLAGLA